MPRKLKSIEELTSIAAEAKAQGKQLVFTNGCFDIVHRGHLHVLRQAKALGDVLIVAVNSDSSVREIKGPSRPIVTQAGRVELIEALEMVDYVAVFDEPDPCRLIEATRPDVLVKGGDWSTEEVVGKEFVERSGGKVAVIPFLPGFSTTKMIEKIRS